jgi:hypothetical protein
MKAFLVRNIDRLLGSWFWRQIERADRDRDFEPKSFGQIGPFEWYWNSHRQWSIGIVYLVHLVWHQEKLRLVWSNPYKAWRYERIARRVLAKLRENNENI